jgi:hypothetical protein
VQARIEELRKQAADDIAEVERLERLRKAFPDLVEDVCRWKIRRYCAASANPLATQVEISATCGCCSDYGVVARPYVLTPDGNVYSDPYKFHVGDAHPDGGDRPTAGWKNTLRNANISDAIIKAIAEHFRKDAEERKQRADASYEHDVSEI